MGAANQIEGVGVPMRATGALEQYALVYPTGPDLSSDGEVECALTAVDTDSSILQNAYEVFATGSNAVTGIPLSAYSTMTVVSGDTDITVGNKLFLAGNGRVANTGDKFIGVALSAATAAGQYVTMLPKIH